jgi:hypothetical protein
MSNWRAGFGNSGVWEADTLLQKIKVAVRSGNRRFNPLYGPMIRMIYKVLYLFVLNRKKKARKSVPGLDTEAGNPVIFVGSRARAA